MTPVPPPSSDPENTYNFKQVQKLMEHAHEYESENGTTTPSPNPLKSPNSVKTPTLSSDDEMGNSRKKRMTLTQSIASNLMDAEEEDVSGEEEEVSSDTKQNHSTEKKLNESKSEKKSQEDSKRSNSQPKQQQQPQPQQKPQVSNQDFSQPPIFNAEQAEKLKLEEREKSAQKIRMSPNNVVLNFVQKDLNAKYFKDMKEKSDDERGKSRDDIIKYMCLEGMTVIYLNALTNEELADLGGPGKITLSAKLKGQSQGLPNLKKLTVNDWKSIAIRSLMKYKPCGEEEAKSLIDIESEIMLKIKPIRDYKPSWVLTRHYEMAKEPTLGPKDSTESESSATTVKSNGKDEDVNMDDSGEKEDRKGGSLVSGGSPRTPGSNKRVFTQSDTNKKPLKKTKIRGRWITLREKNDVIFKTLEQNQKEESNKKQNLKEEFKKQDEQKKKQQPTKMDQKHASSAGNTMPNSPGGKSQTSHQSSGVQSRYTAASNFTDEKSNVSKATSFATSIRSAGSTGSSGTVGSAGTVASGNTQTNSTAPSNATGNSFVPQSPKSQKSLTPKSSHYGTSSATSVHSMAPSVTPSLISMESKKSNVSDGSDQKSFMSSNPLLKKSPFILPNQSLAPSVHSLASQTAPSVASQSDVNSQKEDLEMQSENESNASFAPTMVPSEILNSPSGQSSIEFTEDTNDE